MFVFTLLRYLQTASLVVGGVFMLAICVTAFYEIISVKSPLNLRTERNVVLLFGVLSGIGAIGVGSLLLG